VIEGWKEISVSDLGKVITGGTPSKKHPEDWGDECLFITPSDFGEYGKKASSSKRHLSTLGKNRFAKKILPENSILVTCIGSDMGKVVMNSVTALTNQQINSIVIFDEENDPEFIYYKLVDEYPTLRMLGNDGTALPIVNKSTFENISLHIPLFPEQKAIAEVLSSLDDKIDLLHRQNKTLEALAETLFRQWFIEEVEDDWEHGIIDEILTTKGGTTPSSKNPDYWDGNIHWTTPRDLSNNDGLFLLDTDRKITEAGLAKISSGLLPKGTLLMSSRAPVGYLAFAEVPLAINQGYIGVVADKGFSEYFIYLWLKLNMNYVKSFANGSTFQEISKSSFKSLELRKPSQELRTKFDDLVSPFFSKMKSNIYQIETLKEQRDTLLPKLMNGEVRVFVDSENG